MERKIKMRNIKGLTPAIDPVESQEVFALGGKNYEFDSLGVRSAFGDRLLLPQGFTKPDHLQGARVKLRDRDRVFVFTTDGILEWSEVRGGWLPIYLTPDLTNSPYRWTWGYLNDRVYFCHPRVGLLVYSTETRLCRPHDGPGVPEEPVALTINNGHLVVMTPTLLHWSQPSDGLDFSPTLGGAGFQVISERVSGFPVMLTSYAGGVLTWTTGGIMRSEFTADESVYRHRTLQTEYRPVNSFCTCRIDDDTSVILDERGLFQTNGDKPTPYTPVFNEFIHKYIQENDLKIGTNLRIEWDDLRRYMYVSASLSVNDSIYEECFVLYPNLDQWGQFSEEHYGILPLIVETGQREGDYFGYVDSRGCLRYWNLASSRERPVHPVLDAELSQDLHYPLIQKSTAAIDGDSGWILSSSGKLGNRPSGEEPPRASYFRADGSGISPALLTGLNAEIRVGLVRMQMDESVDQMSEVTQVLLRTGITGPDNQAIVDFNLVPAGVADEDYQEISGADDFGLNPRNYVNHGLKLTGTVDGTSEFYSQIPEIVETRKAARYYACAVPGVWHNVQITADAPGEYFHVTTIELTGIDGGRLN